MHRCNEVWHLIFRNRAEVLAEHLARHKLGMIMTCARWDASSNICVHVTPERALVVVTHRNAINTQVSDMKTMALDRPAHPARQPAGPHEPKM